MKNILIVTNNLLGGGAEKILLNILNLFDRKRFSIDLLLIEKIGIRLNEVPEDVKLSWVFEGENVQALFPKSDNEIAALYAKHVTKQYDVEIAFLEGPATSFVAQSNNPSSHKIAWVHVDLQAFHWTEYLFDSLQAERDVYLKFNDIVFVSKTNLESFQKMFGLKERLHLLYNVVNSDDILKQVKVFKVHERRFMFCYVASISKRKGQEKLIYALKKMIDEGLDCCLYLIGEGAEREQLILLCENLGIRHQVVFTGYHKNPFPFVKAADVIVHASDSEGYPTILCESLILQKPIVATACSGTVDLLQYGEYGLLTEISVESLYDGMKKMMLSHKLRHHYKIKAKKWFLKYDYHKNMQLIQQLWDS